MKKKPSSVIEEGSQSVIETVSLSKKYKDVLAVDMLNMSVLKGEIFGFLGPNGAGKTTTIKMLMGMTHPTNGRAWINRIDVIGDPIAAHKYIGYLPERVAFYDNLTPVQTLNFFCELKGAKKSCVKPLLNEVGLNEASGRKVGTFSKGMIQLLGFAQAMIGEPSIYILDEPTVGLDAQWVKMVRDRIRSLNKDGATIMFSSHILSEVQALCDRVAIIDRGRLIAEDTVTNLSEKVRIKPRLEVFIEGLESMVPGFINDIEGVEAPEADGNKLSLTCEAFVRIKVLEALKENGMEVRDFKTIEPSLEDVFIRLTTKKKEDE